MFKSSRVTAQLADWHLSVIGLDLAKEAAIDEVMQFISKYPEKLADRVMYPDSFGALSKKLC